ncbi:hypothetical protein HD554DRAFT_2178178 [Boletus coccyginus]|nr:hypothetical protein HD554DRAFT_2178178 [Boletus coccyginus]
MTHLAPIIEERLKPQEEYRNDLVDIPNDLQSWLLDVAPEGAERTVEDNLSRVPLRTVITLIKISVSLSDRSTSPPPSFRDEDSWKELTPCVHAPLRRRRPRPRSLLYALSGAVISAANGNGSGTAAMSISSSGSGLSSNASAFVPSQNAIPTKPPQPCLVASFFLGFIHVPSITLLERVTVMIVGRGT